MAGKVTRSIVVIDEEKCDGCGQCVVACAEGALQIVDGKARLVSESYCDGLGACIGDCPRGAITVVESVADAFDEQAVARHLAAQKSATDCPGCASTAIGVTPDREEASIAHGKTRPLLRNWPVQLRLMPVNAPYLEGADLLLAADCVPFAVAEFHARFLAGKIVTIGCPKLDDAQFYVQKLAQVLSQNQVASVHVAYMEVPCCGGLVRIAQWAVDEARTNTPVILTKVGINGEILDERELAG